MSRKDGKWLKTSAERERTARLQVILPADEVAAVDEFRYQARMPSRAGGRLAREIGGANRAIDSARATLGL